MKQKNRIHININIVLIVIAFIILFLVMGTLFLGPIVERKNVMTIYNLKVGSADSSIITYQGSVGIIDAGEDDDADTIIRQLKDLETDSISFMVLTHFDKDHIGSAIDILKTFEVETVFLPNYMGDTKQYKRLMKALKDHPDVRIIGDNCIYDWGDIKVNIYPAKNIESQNNDNNMSLVCMLEYSSKRFLFAGDIMTERIEELIGSGLNLNCDWMKFPHHGKYEEIQEAFLEVTSPEYVVTSDSHKNPCDAQTIQMLEDSGIRWFDTADGTVITRCHHGTIMIGR